MQGKRRKEKKRNGSGFVASADLFVCSVVSLLVPLNAGLFFRGDSGKAHLVGAPAGELFASLVRS